MNRNMNDPHGPERSYDNLTDPEQNGSVFDPEYPQDEYPLPEEAEKKQGRAFFSNDFDPEFLPPEEENRQSRSIFTKRRRKPSFVLAVIINSLRVLLLLCILGCLALAGSIAGIAKGYMDSAPTLDLAALSDQEQTSFMYDRNGVQLCEYMGTENRVMISLSAMPENLQHAFVAVEDARFYSHNGVDVRRILGALFTNFTTGSNQGGSTITQQLIKNTLLSPEQSYKRKIQEAWLAMQLETRYTKDQILECYLNTIYLGENYYGVQVAGYGYFGKSDLNELTLRECAMLAGMTRNPYYYNCRRNFYTRSGEDKDYPAVTNDRTDYVLGCMYQNGFITKEEYEAALDPSTAYVPEKSPDSTGLYEHPHYIEYAMREAVQQMLKKNGLENTSANRVRMESELRTGGYHIYLAIDTGIQQQLEDTVYNYSSYPSLRDPQDKTYRSRKSDGTYEEIVQPQAAAVIMDYRTGFVLGMVGSRTAPTGRKTLNRAVDMNMPVGSSIKPLAVYAPALEMGCSPASVTLNMPLPITGWKNDRGEDSWPVNYGGSDYRGPETMRTALTNSDNTAAAWALMNNVTVENAVLFLRQMGVSDEHINKTPFGVSLGSSGLSPLEMAVGYSTLGNGGMCLSPISVLRITRVDSAGYEQSVTDFTEYQTRTQVFSPSTAWMTLDMLKDAVKNGTGTAAKISGQTVAGKTGTNSDQKGVTFAGLTGYYCASVWIGHDNYKALSSRTTGGNSAAKLWQAFMKKIHQNLKNREIMEGTGADWGLVKVETCAVSGLLATDACRHDVNGYGTATDYWRAGTQPTQYCPMHLMADVCETTGELAGAGCPDTDREGILVIPVGHPLYNLIGTQYEGVLTDYLGSFASIRLTGNSAADQASISLHSCSVHSGFVPAMQGSASPETIREAQQLLNLANSKLAELFGGEAGFAELMNARDELQALLALAPDDEQLYQQMTRLSRALATVY